MAKGMSDSETMNGLVGGEVAEKLRAFMRVKVDIADLIKFPEKFLEITLDARYMLSLMLATWISKNIKKPEKVMPLIDVMTGKSREFLLLVCTSLSKQKLIQFIKHLIKHKAAYKEMLSEIALDIKESISV